MICKRGRTWLSLTVRVTYHLSVGNGAVVPLWETLLDDVLGQTKANKLTVLNVGGDLWVEHSSGSVIVSVLGKKATVETGGRLTCSSWDGIHDFL